MPQRRKHRRSTIQLPVLCRIRNRREEIIISSPGKTNNLSLGGMNVSLPIHLIMIRARLIEYTVELPENFTPLVGKGIVRWGFWDEENRQTTLGVEMNDLPGDQCVALENLMDELSQDEFPPFFHSLNN